MKFGIVMFPSKALQDRANNLRKRYDSHYALIPPHITLKQVFETPETEVETIVQQLKGIAAKVQPFTIQVSKVNSFYPINNVIYLKIDKTPELELLNERMYSDYFTQKREYSFLPHITIAQGLSDQEHADVLGRLKMVNFRHEQVVDRFHLLYQLEDGAWTVYETFHLGNE